MTKTFRPNLPPGIYWPPPDDARTMLRNATWAVGPVWLLPCGLRWAVAWGPRCTLYAAPHIGAGRLLWWAVLARLGVVTRPWGHECPES